MITKPNLFCGSLLLAVMFVLVGCESTPTRAKAKSGAKISGSLQAELNNEKEKETKAIQEEIAKLGEERKNTSLLTAAQDDEFCTLYELQGRYAFLLERSNRGNLQAISRDLEKSVSDFGKQVGAVAYLYMQNGKSFACGTGEGRKTAAEMIEAATKIMDKYGPADQTTKYDPKVVRAAYLKAIRPEIQESIAEFNRRPESGDALGALSWKVEMAQAKWHFTLTELGVPPAIARRVEYVNAR